MNKNTIQKSVEVVPELISNLKDWLKTGFEEHAQDVLEASSGTIGLIIKLIGKKAVENYFDKLSQKKLDNFGIATYFKSAYNQASKSIIHIETKLTKNSSTTEVIQSLSEVFDYQLRSFTKDDAVLVFQPNYHPAVLVVKNAFIQLLKKLSVDDSSIDIFIKNFNENIQQEVEDEFGDDYKKHLARIKKFVFQERELELLFDMIKLGKIGFGEDEDLSYETTFAEWHPVHSLHSYSYKNRSDYFVSSVDSADYAKRESSLKKATDLIEAYFKNEPNLNIEKILFLVADFGKGKSVFLRYYASILAKSYLATGDGYIPVYFNLRNYHNYSPEATLGVLHDFLQSKYGINIAADYYKVKKYIYLVDSLDESGELNKNSVEKVLESVRRIQNIDKSLYRDNRIIVSTRPFDGGLQGFLEQHRPFTIKENKKEISQYISIFGFKSSQFNNWLNNTLKSSEIMLSENSPELVRKIVYNISVGVDTDVYTELVKTNTLSRSELQRPIFAYMIYQLIVNNVDFLKVGKIGVYLSFLNLLSKEAKHINDPSYKVNLKEEFEFRNILHAIASLWMYERHQGKQGALNKADICRVLDGQNSGESDFDILNRYKNKKVLEIEFLSHSYFGESNNTLHFQHQSFAEILLAEYYLKVFIKYALDEDSSNGPEEARAKLSLGQPTDQTISFFIELLQLLKETSVSECSQEIIQKRKLLFPLLASLSIRKNNLLMCNELAYSWYKKVGIDDYSTEYSEGCLIDWCINDSHIERIVTLASDILNSSNSYYLINSERVSALFDNELTLVKNSKIGNAPILMDRWLALIVGNTLYNKIVDEKNTKLFNKDFKVSPINLFELIAGISNVSIASNNTPSWGYNLFMGIDMSSFEEKIFLSKFIAGINLSYSYLKNVDFIGSLLVNVNMSNCYFNNVSLSHSAMYRCDFSDIRGVDNVRSTASFVNMHSQYIPFDLFSSKNSYLFNNEIQYISVPDLSVMKKKAISRSEEFESIFVSVLNMLRPFFRFQLKGKMLTIKKIDSLIHFENADDRETYIASLL